MGTLYTGRRGRVKSIDRARRVASLMLRSSRAAAVSARTESAEALRSGGGIEYAGTAARPSMRSVAIIKIIRGPGAFQWWACGIG